MAKPERKTDQVDQAFEIQEYETHLQTVRGIAAKLEPVVDAWLNNPGTNTPAELEQYMTAVRMIDKGLLTRVDHDFESIIAGLRRPNPYEYGPPK